MTSITGFTRARSMGGVAEAVQRAGGSVQRLFRRCELPLRLLEHPDQPILLRDQLALVECAAHEVGDDALAPRLSLLAGFRHLGPLGDRLAQARNLYEAIVLCNAGICGLLQSATRMTLVTEGPDHVAWTYRVLDPSPLGKARNEVLALGYMLDLVRHHAAGRSGWHVRLPAAVPGAQAISELLGCVLERGPVAALVFPAGWLACSNAQQPPQTGQVHNRPALPDEGDLVAGVVQLMQLALLEQRPCITWMARRLGIGTRSLQRQLALQGQTFGLLRDQALHHRAEQLLAGSGLSLTEVAYELGYAEPAHFTRAARRWSGQAPSSWRRSLRSARGMAA